MSAHYPALRLPKADKDGGDEGASGLSCLSWAAALSGGDRSRDKVCHRCRPLRPDTYTERRGPATAIENDWGLFCLTHSSTGEPKTTMLFPPTSHKYTSFPRRHPVTVMCCGQLRDEQFA